MKERPILFSAPMIQAILDDRKTQTRRIMNPQPSEGWEPFCYGYVLSRDMNAAAVGHGPLVPAEDYERHVCPYGKPGDRMWVRETFIAHGRWEMRFNVKKGRDEWHFLDMTAECGHTYKYAADGNDVQLARGGALPGWHRRPSIFMPRSASRITLEITDVRVERVQDISEADAKAEGVLAPSGRLAKLAGLTYKHEFERLWVTVHDDLAAWADNPWVFVIEFKRVSK